MGSHSTRLIRFVASTSAVGLVAASAGFGSVFAYRIGIEHGTFLAILSVTMALALEGVKPLAIAYGIRSLREFKIGPGLALMVLGLVAVAYSLTSELSLMAASRSDLQARREAEGQNAKQARERLQRLNTELLGLSQTPSVAELDAVINGKLSSRKHLNGCVGWLPSSRDRQVCVEVSELQAERARAETRTKLEQERFNLEALLRSRGSGVVQADPGSQSLSVYLGALGIVVSSGVVATWINLVPVLALEIGSAFALVLVGAVQGREGSVSVHGPTVVPNHTAESMQLVPYPTGLRDRVSLEIMRQLMLRGGSLHGSERAIAEMIGADRSTVRRAVNEMAEVGRLSVSSSKRGTVLRLT